MADVALYRGWLAYVDPLFAMFMFAAIAALWVACTEDRPALLAAAVLALTCAFMSKAFTAYVFYASAVFVQLFTSSGRRVLLGRFSIAMHLAALMAPLAWLHWVPANSGQGPRMFAEVVAKLMPESGVAYLRQLIGFPAESLVAAVVLWRSGEAVIGKARRWLVGMLVFKVILLAFLFPYYQHDYRGENYAQAAGDIVALTAGHPLYVNDVSASGMSVAGYIDSSIYPAPALKRAPAEWESGFVIAYEEDQRLGRTFKHYKLAANSLYLLCRGAACAAAQ